MTKEQPSEFERTPNIQKIIERFHSQKRKPFGEIMAQIENQKLGSEVEMAALGSEEYFLNILQGTVIELRGKNPESLTQDEMEVLDRGPKEFEEIKKGLLSAVDSFIAQAGMALAEAKQKYDQAEDAMLKDFAKQEMDEWEEESKGRFERSRRIESMQL